MFSETKQPHAKSLTLGQQLPPSPGPGGWEASAAVRRPRPPRRVHTRCSSTSAAAGVPALCLQSPCLHKAPDRTRPSDPRTLGHSTGGSREPRAPGKERPMLFFWV